ncbi:hypothetical protein QJS10_CPA09g00067 [Acorus calamus]|uniref:FLZ-type domain-containing protein n=1 Tax=Acorus calamus TaxID=4465 RepID=A0AAV9EBS1_ACOCL|nr:hypothetical protein QJS10_CPA09g00067 [Acorus calamus]
MLRRNNSPVAMTIPTNQTVVIEPTRSPRVWRAPESEGVGLGIVAALERSSSGGDQAARAVVGSPKVHLSVPMTIVGKRSGEEFKVADFLSCCYLCRKKLHGKDIYMYRGEKAFCSMECRYWQIVSDECQESCGSEVSKASDVSVSPYTTGRFFCAGVAAA